MSGLQHHSSVWPLWQYLPLRVSGLRAGKSRLSVEIGDGQWEISGLEPVSLEVIAAPRPARSG
jgi:hypothetical protein